MSQPQFSSMGATSQLQVSESPYPDQARHVIDSFLECKRENQERLKQVKNLEDLINFKVTTIADKMKDKKTDDFTSGYGLDFFTKLCDPLLANQHYPSLTKKAYLTNQPSTNKRNLNNQSRADSNIPELNQPSRLEIPSQQSITQIKDYKQSTEKELAKDDPVKFLQQYFKKPEVTNKRKIAPSYIMAKYQRLEEKKKSQSMNRSQITNNNQRNDDVSFVQQQNISAYNAESNVYISNQQDLGQNFFDTKAHSQVHSLPPKVSKTSKELNNVDSLNVLNFQKMREEIKKMFVEDEEKHMNRPENILAHQQYPLSQDKIKGSYNQQLKDIIKDNSSSDDYGEEKGDGYGIMDDQDSFVDFPLMNLNSDNGKVNKDRWKELQKRERKIQKILQNKYSKKAKVNYLSDIQSVKAIGFERFSKDIAHEQNQKYGFPFAKTESQPSKYQDTKQLKQELSSLRKSQLRERNEKDKSLDLVIFNKNKNFEQLQQRLIQAQTQQTQDQFANNKRQSFAPSEHNRAMSLGFQNYHDQSEGPMHYSIPETQKPSQLSSKFGFKGNNTQMSFEEYTDKDKVEEETKDLKIRTTSNDQSSIELNNAEQQVSSQQFSPQNSVTREMTSEYTHRGKVMFIKKKDAEQPPKTATIQEEKEKDNSLVYSHNQPLRQKVVIPQLHIQENYLMQKSSSRINKTIPKGMRSQQSSKAFIQNQNSGVAIVQASGYESQQEPADLAREELHHQIMEAQAKRSRAWSPRRFKKFPRFTIFLNRDEDKQEYQKDNIICLNPDFMNFLLNPASNEAEQNIALQIQDHLEAGSLDQALKIYSKNSEKFKQIDPFEKVLLTKGIDNQILTSFRTLAKTNNLISDTFKIVHNKFSPFPTKTKIMGRMKQHYYLYPINEELIQDEEVNDAQFIQENLKNIYNSKFTSLDVNVKQSDQGVVGTRESQRQYVGNNGKIIYSMHTPPAKTMYIKRNDDYTSEVKKTLLSPQNTFVPSLPPPLDPQMNHTQSQFYDEKSQIDKNKTPQHREGSVFSHGMSTEYKNQQQQLYQQQQEQIYEERKRRLEEEKEQLRQIIRVKHSNKKESSTKQAIILQKVDPIELFGMRRLSKDELNDSQQEVLLQQLENGLLQEVSRNLYERESLQMLPINQMSAMPKKKGLSFAGGFQAYNMNVSKADIPKQATFIQQPPKDIRIQNISAKDMGNLSALDLQNKSSKHIDLKNEERIEFTKKLTLPPVNKLKHMIDELYTKEKKYVKHYVREDYIEQNNFIFDLQKCHNLGSAQLKNGKMSAKRAMKANEIFVGVMKQDLDRTN